MRTGYEASVVNVKPLYNIDEKNFTCLEQRTKGNFQMQNRVFVLNSKKEPLMPCHPSRARRLLKRREAAIFLRFPFTIIMKRETEEITQSLQLGIDPGSKKSGLALISFNQRSPRVIWAAEVEHRGQRIRKLLEKRRGVRRSRRYRKCRYRPPRFLNRKRKEGWVAPSLKSRVQNIVTWTKRLRAKTPLTHIVCESVRFDTQRLENPEISGIEYQQGTLRGYEVREFLLEKFSRTCVYCKAKNVPLQVEHITPKSRGGTNKLSNLTIACSECNQKKGSKTAEEFGFPNVQKGVGKCYKDAAAVNSTRKYIVKELEELGLYLELGTGGQTKFNRSINCYPKAHWIDAACVGSLGDYTYLDPTFQFLQIKAVGRGSRQMCKIDKYGFPCAKSKSRGKYVFGFMSGDTAKVTKSRGKYKGHYTGALVVRITGRFDVRVKGVKLPAHYKQCSKIHSFCGYRS